MMSLKESPGKYKSKSQTLSKPRKVGVRVGGLVPAKKAPMAVPVKAAWISALQGQAYRPCFNLRNGTCFSALGVLCDLHLQKVKNGEWIPVIDYGHEFSYSTGIFRRKWICLLPENVGTWAKVSEVHAENIMRIQDALPDNHYSEVVKYINKFL